MKKIFVCNNTNCRRRLLDASKIKLYLTKNGYELVDNPKKADITIFLTCAFKEGITENALNKIKILNELDTDLIVAGCLPEIEKDKLSKIFDGPTLSTKKIYNIDNFFPNNKIKFSDIEDADAIVNEQRTLNQFETLKLSNLPVINKFINFISQTVVKNILNDHLMVYLHPTNKRYYHVRISWGCLGNCSYCGIKKAIGPLISKPLKTCINDFKTGVEYGYKNIIITADDVGAYGIDNKSSFPELLDKLTKIKGDYNVSVQDFDPKWLVKYIDELEHIFSKGKINSVNIALQNGSGRILQLMNRYSNIDKIKDSLIRLKNTNTDLSLDTHFIIGFPTETERDFLDTMDFINQINFDVGFIYNYSPKPGTKAELLEPKVTKNELAYRLSYAKKFLKKNGYKMITLTKNNFYCFYKRG
jgi:tRNA A37 methylthiotransferase MiaB